MITGVKRLLQCWVFFSETFSTTVQSYTEEDITTSDNIVNRTAVPTVDTGKEMKNTKCYNVKTIPKSDRKMLERRQPDTHNTHIYYDCSFSWFGTDTSIQSGGLKLVLCASFLIEYNLFPENMVLLLCFMIQDFIFSCNFKLSAK